MWCRWFHRWHPAYLGGYTRDVCCACERYDYGRD
jgi:hypothetical protein